ncbi:hypothetical protein DV736_g3159, partial [Chaetothyriales sp. CBS 134916]
MLLRSNSVGHELGWKAGDSAEIQETQNDLRKRIIELYILIMKFQINAAYHLCRHSGSQRLRGVFKVDSWTVYLNDIDQSEKFCWELINKINSDRSKSRADREDFKNQNHELDLLPITAAAFNDYDIQQEKRQCLDNTRVELLKDIMDWSVGSQPEPICWLKGLAGTGKSTVAMTVAQRLTSEGRLAASFFFSRSRTQGYGRNFFTTVARQMANLSQNMRHLIADAIAQHHDFAQKEFAEQWKWLILEPLQKCHTFWTPIVIVIDALDECDHESHVEEILGLLSEYNDIRHLSLRIFITSSPDDSVITCIHTPIYNVDLHKAQDTEKDIRLFLGGELSRIRDKRKAGPDWPDEKDIDLLTQKAGKLFIYAATACRFIDVRSCKKQLELILKSDKKGLGELYQIYAKILETAASRGVLEDEQETARSDLTKVIATMVVLFTPLSVSGLREFLPDLETDIKVHLDSLASVLAVSDRGTIVQMYHLSFRDYVLDIRREGMSATSENMIAFLQALIRKR